MNGLTAYAKRTPGSLTARYAEPIHDSGCHFSRVRAVSAGPLPVVGVGLDQDVRAEGAQAAHVGRAPRRRTAARCGLRRRRRAGWWRAPAGRRCPGSPPGAGWRARRRRRWARREPERLLEAWSAGPCSCRRSGWPAAPGRPRRMTCGAPDEGLVVGDARGRGIDDLGRGPPGSASAAIAAAIAGEPERGLGVGGDHVQAVPAGHAGHRGHEHAHELVGGGDEAPAQLVALSWG